MEASSPPTVTVIEPRRGWRMPNLKEVWIYRDLLYFLARRDVVIRYKQAIVGVFWAILQPLFIAGVFSVFLGLLLKLPAPEGIPFPLFAVTGMVLWLTFTNGLVAVTESTLASESLISKIYFPRLVIPIAAVVPSAVDFAISFVVLLAITLAYGVTPGVALLTVPLILLLVLTTTLGMGLWLSALNVRYRDVHLVVPLLILAGLFVTPVLYSFETITAQVAPQVGALYALNPLVGELEAFRWAILGTDWPGLLLMIPFVSSLFLLVSGAFYFRRAESTFADVI
jgi:lipopolysaccharide transport system permease protein